ncbi:hypothetical protein LzC2_24960 [Planctomycetes bacterium LzC2]|uniref:Integrase n=1 Tax=Alienimonas chondri TaxID=2681879 RepID=A0ABX1VEA6_9PLAN|nr:hypothetical protein [Alienimonas chondri]
MRFVGPDRTRRSVILGKISKRSATDLAGLIDRLNAANIAGTVPSDEDARRVAALPEVMHGRFAAAGLIAPRRAAKPATLGPFVADYVDRHPGKHLTVYHLRNTGGLLVEYFGAERPLRSITRGDADRFAAWLATSGRNGNRKPATVGRYLGRAKQFFHAAERDELIDAGRNPFKDQKTATKADKSRQRFITPEEARRVLAACPDAEWRLIFALARYGGLRVPSELAPLTWDDIHWPDPSAADPKDQAGWMFVRSPKTEHHEDKESRVVPLFGDLLPYLEEAYHVARPGTVAVVPRAAPRNGRKANLGTQMNRIIERAGLVPWPKTFTNLRASRATEIARDFPAHLESEWIGHDAKTAREHYLQVTGADFATAAG